jgi:hypothetical protein
VTVPLPQWREFLILQLGKNIDKMVMVYSIYDLFNDAVSSSDYTC